MVIWVAVGLTVIGGAVSAYGQYQSGQAQKKMMNYQADVANQQAVLAQRTADQKSQLTQTQAMLDTKQLQRKYAILEGTQAASRAASGVGGGSGSSGDIATDTFKTQSLDEQMIRYNSDLKSWDLQQHAGMEVWGLGAEANMDRQAGKNAATAGTTAAAGTVLQTAGSAMMMGYSAYKPTGIGAANTVKGQGNMNMFTKVPMAR